jgi:glutathione S-transferase
MKLRLTPTSPYARKCLVLAHEAGIADRIERVAATIGMGTRDDALTADNPLGKVPVLVTDDGEVVYDSPVICEYLDSLNDGRKLIPAAGMERFRALRREALADGIADAAVLARMEIAVRPEALRWPEAAARQRGKVMAGLDALEAEVETFAAAPDVGQIAAACAIAYLDLRFPDEDWRTARPKLAAWYAAFERRPSMVATRFTAP